MGWGADGLGWGEREFASDDFVRDWADLSGGEFNGIRDDRAAGGRLAEVFTFESFFLDDVIGKDIGMADGEEETFGGIAVVSQTFLFGSAEGDGNGRGIEAESDVGAIALDFSADLDLAIECCDRRNLMDGEIGKTSEDKRSQKDKTVIIAPIGKIFIGAGTGFGTTEEIPDKEKMGGDDGGDFGEVDSHEFTSSEFSCLAWFSGISVSRS